MKEDRSIDVRSFQELPPGWGRVADHLNGGGVLAYPTETVYGFGSLVREGEIERLSRAKRRGAERPFLVLVPSAESVADLAWMPAARELAELFWPGALTLILEDPLARFPHGVRSDRGAVAVRVSPHPVVKALVEVTGNGITSTSANVPGSPPALDLESALMAADELGFGDAVLGLDAGLLEPSRSSTVVDCTGDVPVVVREGVIPLSRLRCVRPEVS